MAAIPGKDGSSSIQVSPTSPVSQILPPVVPKQNAPFSSPSKALLSTAGSVPGLAESGHLPARETWGHLPS